MYHHISAPNPSLLRQSLARMQRYFANRESYKRAVVRQKRFSQAEIPNHSQLGGLGILREAVSGVSRHGEGNAGR